MLLVRTLVFTILVPGFVAVWMPQWALGQWPERWAGFGSTAVPGWLLVFFGSSLYAQATARFFLDGKGTPAVWFTKPVAFLIGKEPERLVAGGLYRRTRNPMYLGVATSILGQGLIFHSTAVLAYGAIAWAVFHCAVLFIEEPHLRAREGESYLRFCREVPRWIPRLRS
ncbi:MAG: isoprenylcysteine carboxylmethyltransferase family protein [Bryobacterales bacterium]|nr:isoprenylcysteine carboxylmethyltransferase family protein [Bryobacterales bacterium]